jgi:hypothetical protein
MKKFTKIEMLIVLLIIGIPAGIWVISETRWAKINNPSGKFTNIVEYLAYGRLPAQATIIQKDKKEYIMAYGPLDSWMAVPSGTAVYVFDMSGKLVDWCSDSGEASRFNEKWKADSSKKITIQELRDIKFQLKDRPNR